MTFYVSMMVERFTLLEDRLMNIVLEDKFRAKVLSRKARKLKDFEIVAATF